MPHAFVVGVPCPGNVARCFRRAGSVAKVFVNGGVSNSGKDRDVYPGNKLTGGGGVAFYFVVKQSGAIGFSKQYIRARGRRHQAAVACRKSTRLNSSHLGI